MPDDREKELKKRIRTLTKRIGEAGRSGDHNEVENLRQQRSNFIGQLIDEFDLYYWIVDGKSKFGTQEEVNEHYEEPENRKKLAIAGALTDLFQGRAILKRRFDQFGKLDAEEAKQLVLSEIADQLLRVEKTIHDFEEESDKEKTDFNQLDENQDDGDDFLDGIDLTSLA